jgi:hypothetical protein
MCLCKLEFTLNLLPHISHLYGLSPVCVLVINLMNVIYVVEDFVGIGTLKDTLEHTLVIILCDKGFIASSISK